VTRIRPSDSALRRQFQDCSLVEVDEWGNDRHGQGCGDAQKRFRLGEKIPRLVREQTLLFVQEPDGHGLSATTAGKGRPGEKEEKVSAGQEGIIEHILVSPGETTWNVATESG
jgi:hypothetical protein